MPPIIWDDSFSVNNTEIDDQHKKWIALFNKLDETMLKGNLTVLNTAKDEALKAMQDYTRYHFKFEEEYMKKIDYPRIAEHVRIHKNFDNLIYGYNRDIRDGKVVLNTELIKTIKNWLLDHILIEDKKYSLYEAEPSNQ